MSESKSSVKNKPRLIYLSIGSNLSPAQNVPDCLRMLKVAFSVVRISSIYETSPVGPSGSQAFWNLAVSIKTTLDFEALQDEIRKLEKLLGRVRDPKNKFAPRTIDIDILPQPGFQGQPFIMIPLAEIAPNELDPETGKTFGQIAAQFARELKEYRKVS